MSKIQFKEKQRYDNKVVMGILLVTGAVSLIAAASILLLAPESTSRAVMLLCVTGVAWVVYWLLSKLELKLTVSKNKVKYKLSWFYTFKNSFRWDDIEHYEVVKTPELAQWSGANITYGNERTISLNGRNGLSLTTKNGEHYFLGSKNVGALESTLDRLFDRS